MKRCSVWLPSAMLALLLPVGLGCGGPSEKTITAEDNPRFGPHNGPLVPLTEVDGYVEIVEEHTADGLRLVAYFYQTKSAQSALSPTPSEVAISLATPDGSHREVMMEPTPISNESGGDARFISEPIDEAVDPLIGTVNATIQGQTVTASFSTKHY